MNFKVDIRQNLIILAALILIGNNIIIPQDTSFVSNSDSASSFTIPEGLTAETVLGNYVNALGGIDSLASITDRTTIMNGKMQGVSVNITAYQKTPNKLKQVFNAGQVQQQMIFDGERGVMILGDVVTEIEGNELEKMKIESAMDFIYNYAEYGVNINLLGTEDINGSIAYVIEFTKPGGSKWTADFDVDTGLKIIESKTIETNSGAYSQETIFDDYRQVGGVKFPFKLTQTFGSQKLEFNVTSININTGLADSIFEIK